MELTRKDLVYKQEDAAVNADKYDVRRFNELYKMAGNSVSVPVISAIGQKIKTLNDQYKIVR